MPNGQTAPAEKRNYYQTARTRRTALTDDISNDETINGLARSCLTGFLTAIKSEIAKTIANTKSEKNSGLSTATPMQKDENIDADKGLPKKQDDSFSAKEEEEEMDIDFPGISVNSIPRADGRYQGHITDNGERTYVYGRTINEVKWKIRELLKFGIPKKKRVKKDTSPTVKEWGEKWIELYKAPNLKPKSIESLRYCLKKIYIKYANTHLNSLNALDLQEYFLSMKETRARDMALHTLTEMLEKARKQRLIKENPCDGVEIKKHVKEQKCGLTPDEQRTLEKAVKGMLIEPIFQLLLTGGFRIGELLALTSDDVDFENNKVHINKDVVFIKNQRIVQTTKTKAGNRIIPLPEKSMEYLKGREGVLFNTTYNAVQNLFKRLTKKTGINISAHILRHTYSNRLEEAGIPPKVKQYLLGHAKLDTTQNVYTDTQAHYVGRFLDDIRGAFDTRLTPKMTP